MDNQISVTQALNSIQSWLNAGEYDKVIQGCQEILTIEPGNQRALALMKRAEDSRIDKQAYTPPAGPLKPGPETIGASPEPITSPAPSAGNPAPLSPPIPVAGPAVQNKTPEPKPIPKNPAPPASEVKTSPQVTTPEPAPSTASPSMPLPSSPEPNMPESSAPASTKPKEDPLASLKVEGTDASTANLNENPQNMNVHQDPDMFKHDFNDHPPVSKKKLFLAMLIPALLVVLIGGGIFFFLKNQQREVTIETSLSEIAEETSYLEQNEERIQTINSLHELISLYHETEGVYPSANQIDDVILTSDDFEELPQDPKQGDLDKAGKTFGYYYAVYDGLAGEDSSYVLSGLFEDSRGYSHPWTGETSTKNFPDYQDTSQDHVVIIGEK